MLGMEQTRLGGIIDEATTRKEVLELSEKYGLTIDPDAKIEDISVGIQQRVEILKALYRGARYLVLDEPTAVLTPQEIGELIEIMHRLAGDGKTIIIITHKLGEIKKSADYCTIIRRGRYIDTVRVDDVDETDLASMMVGREVKLSVTKEKADPGEVLFSISGLTVEDTRGIERVKDLSLEVRRGEILGIAGIDGNGRRRAGGGHHEYGAVQVGQHSGAGYRDPEPHSVGHPGSRHLHHSRGPAQAWSGVGLLRC